MEKPKAREDVTIQILGDEVMIYDAQRENVHVLNKTAKNIWALCDGRHTIEEMAEALFKEYPDMNEKDLLTDIKQTVAEFKQKNMLN